MKFVKVRKSNGEKTRIQLAELGALDKDYRIVQKGGFLYLPVKEKIKGSVVVDIRVQKIKNKKPKTLKEALAGKLNADEINALITSFDIIGDIAIVEIDPALAKNGKKEKTIAHALMAVHPNVKIVAKKMGGMEGEYRIRPLKVIAGENRTETLYKESGCSIKLDVAKTYFSVRLSHERERIAALVGENKDMNENVLVMFAGVGPFALVIAKKTPNAHVVGIELNPDATRYFKENITLNKLANCEAIEGDVRTIIPKRFTGWADRVLMPLPKSAEDYLDVAFLASKDGAIIHFYSFGKQESAFEDVKTKVRDAAQIANVNVEFVNERIVRPYAPGVVQVCLDFRVKKK